MIDTVSVVGLGKLGLPLAASFASRMPTMGVDLDPAVVEAVNAGRALWEEPGLGALLEDHGGQSLRATTSHAEAVAGSDATIVLVPTPSLPDGTFSSALLVRALMALGGALRASAKPAHLFIISSTVTPGAVESELIPVLEEASGRREGEGFHVCYVPDFVALGETVRGFQHPEFLLIGERRKAAGDTTEGLYRRMCRNDPHVARMSLASAEIAKVALNAFITVKITFANHLANVCERVPGADVDAITHAIGTDSRISRRYFTGGMAFGGTCFPRDTVAYRVMSDRVGLPAPLLAATEAINTAQNDHLYATVRSYRPSKVGVLGIAFRPDTPVTEASPAVDLIRRLSVDRTPVVAWDPLARESLPGAVEWAASADACLAAVDVAVITHRSRAFREAVGRCAPARPLTVIDCWRIVDAGSVHANVRVHPMGRHPDRPLQ